MKLVQAREWADIYLSSPHLSQEAYSLEAMLIEKKDEGAKHVMRCLKS